MLSIAFLKFTRWQWGLLLSMVMASNVSAQVQINENLSLSGFGTISAAKSDQSTPVLINREISDSWCFDCDTTLGLQLDWVMTNRLRSTLQVVKRPQDTFSDPEIERAFIEYALYNTRIKAGRLRTPLFLMSEYYYVSSAYPWLRLPPNIYANSLGITHYDGVSVDSSFLIGEESQLSITPFIALPSEEGYERYGQSFTLDVSQAAGLSVELYQGDHLFRFAYVNAEVKQIFAQQFQDKFDIDMFSLGMSRYFGNWHLQAETLLSDQTHANWYLGLDYQWGEYAPYIQYGQSRRRIDSNSYLVGLRYNWTDTINSTIEWQQVHGEKSVVSGFFTEPQNPAQPFATRTNIISLGVSFTF